MGMSVDWDIVNNEIYSEPNSEYYEKEQASNAKEDAIIYAQLIDALAEYIKNYKSRAIKLLAKHRIRTGDTDQEVVNAMVEILYIGDKAFKDDLVSDLMEVGIIRPDGQQAREENFVLTTAVIVAGLNALGVIGGGTLALAGKSKDIKSQKQAMKGEIIKTLSEKKRAEMESKSKQQRLITWIIAISLLALIIAIVMVYLKNKQKQKA